MKACSPWITVIFASASVWSSTTDLINLEDIAHDYVLETKQIMLPQYPHAFNPSIVRWRGKILLSFQSRSTII